MRRLSGKIARDVKKFWYKVDKIISFKQKAESDEVRQKAMDKHLDFLIKQTERYTKQLADYMTVSDSDKIMDLQGNYTRLRPIPSSPQTSLEQWYRRHQP